MAGRIYRERCLGLGLSVPVLAELLGVTDRGLRKRFREDAKVRTEAILALEMLEHRVITVRYDRLMGGGRR